MMLNFHSRMSAGGRLLCALAALQNAAAHAQLLRHDALPALLHALDMAWINTCAAEVLFYLCERCAAMPLGLFHCQYLWYACTRHDSYEIYHKIKRILTD